MKKQNKNIIIDSKVSLVAYERFFNADSAQAQKEALQAHILSLRQHIKGLDTAIVFKLCKSSKAF